MEKRKRKNISYVYRNMVFSEIRELTHFMLLINGTQVNNKNINNNEEQNA